MKFPEDIKVIEMSEINIVTPKDVCCAKTPEDFIALLRTFAFNTVFKVDKKYQAIGLEAMYIYEEK